jgi:hypothetical protein
MGRLQAARTGGAGRRAWARRPQAASRAEMDRGVMGRLQAALTIWMRDGDIVVQGQLSDGM